MANELDFTVDQIDHVEVFVSDLIAAARWYAEVLGLKEICRWDPEPIMIGAGNTKLALFKASAVTAGGEGSWHRVAWRTNKEGFDAAQGHLARQGIEFRGPIDHGIARSIYFQDMDGHPLEITYYVE